MTEAPTEDDFDRAVRRATAVIGLVVTVGEIVYLVDTRMLTEPSRMAAWVRRRRPGWSARWSRLTAARRAREEAPEVIFEAWAHAQGWQP